MIEWLSWKVNRNLIVALNNNRYILISPYLKNPLIFNLPRRGYYPEQRFWHTTLAYINFPSQQPGPGPESCRANQAALRQVLTQTLKLSLTTWEQWLSSEQRCGNIFVRTKAPVNQADENCTLEWFYLKVKWVHMSRNEVTEKKNYDLKLQK